MTKRGDFRYIETVNVFFLNLEGLKLSFAKSRYMCGMFLHAYVRQWPTEEIIVKMYQANYLKYQRDRKSYKIRRFDNAYNINYFSPYPNTFS